MASTTETGQDKNVFIYKFITKASIEEKILNLQNAKKWLARELISTEGSIKKGLSEEDVKNLFA